MILIESFIHSFVRLCEFAKGTELRPAKRTRHEKRVGNKKKAIVCCYFVAVVVVVAAVQISHFKKPMNTNVRSGGKLEGRN